jgi:TolA-binding protein
MIESSHRLNLLFSSLLGISMLIGTSAVAQDAPDRVPTLDELLGLEEINETPDTTKLDEALSPKQAGEAFTQAVGLMGQAADRIDESQDAGITTQRMQEEIIRKLEQIIESAQQNQNSSSNSSSSGSSSQQQQQPNQQTQQQDSPNSGDGEPSDSSMPSGSTDVGANDLSNGVARWGNLPDRLRDALSQGLDEPYSQLYRTLTERYYKALAEEEE